MNIKIRHKMTGDVLLTFDEPDLTRADLPGADLPGADLPWANLAGADLAGANLRRANLRGADLRGADLERANLAGADLARAHLQGANLRGANLTGADLAGAILTGADLRWANLREAIMPDGRTYEQWQADPLAGLCDTPEATDRAIAAWGAHTWADCPMHAAHGWNGVETAPEEKRQLVATFVALFDGLQLPAPGSKNK